MRRLFLFCAILFFMPLKAQNNLGVFLVSGVEDTRTFAENYLRPASEATLATLSNGWYQTAEVKGLLGFEISIIGNAVINLDQSQSFFLNTEDYQNIRFSDGAIGKEVSTILGQNDPDIDIIFDYRSASGESGSISAVLPEGIGAGKVKYIPTAYLQARLGVFKGTEIKARYFPRINYADVELGIYGGALQHEFTSWIPASDLFPVAISGLVGYTKLAGTYDFTAEEYIKGANQHLDVQMDSWLVAAIVSTKIPFFNVYGGIGYAFGNSKTQMLGTYEVQNPDTGGTIVTVKDPLSLSQELSGVKANLGLSIKIGVLKLTADYNFNEYQAISVGVHAGL